MSYELLFTARVMGYSLHTRHELLFIARVNIYFLYTSYELFFAYELQVTFYCATRDCDIDCNVWLFLYYSSYSFSWPSLYKLSILSPLFHLSNVIYVNESLNAKLQSAFLSYVKFFFISMTYSLQYEVSLAKCY